MKSLAPVLMGAILALISFVPRAGATGMADMWLRFYDADQDDRITRKEYDDAMARLAERLGGAPRRSPAVGFTDVDADGDGVVTRQELDGYGREMMGRYLRKQFDRYDLDGNGRVTQQEVEEMRQRALSPAQRSRPGNKPPSIADFDMDGDGAVTFEEFRKRFPEVSRRAARPAGDGG